MQTKLKQLYKKRDVSESGFTLIELLVVMTIIALLASVVFASIGQIQKKARDTRRIEDVDTIFKALQLYQTGNYRFPKSVATTTIDGTDDISVALQDAGAVQKMPTDPLHPDFTYQYVTNAIGTDFIITYCLETTSIPDSTADCTNTKTP